MATPGERRACVPLASPQRSILDVVGAKGGPLVYVLHAGLFASHYVQEMEAPT